MPFTTKTSRQYLNFRDWKLYENAALKIDDAKLRELAANAEVFAERTTEVLADATHMAHILRRAYGERKRNSHTSGFSKENQHSIARGKQLAAVTAGVD